MKRLLCYIIVIITKVRGFCHQNVSTQTFPANFMIGVGTSAYQIEGAWNESGKGVSIWDTYVHDKTFIVDGSTGDVAANSYHLYKQDVKALNQLGVDFYRFSISWPRILPTGLVNVVNQHGIDYYNKLIDELKANNIEPMVTMYHWDLPQPLQDVGGWANAAMADYFEDYAHVLYSNFGDRVKWWITINEPFNVAMGYDEESISAPGVNAKGTGSLLAAHTLIRAHAKAYRLYDKTFRARQKGKLSLSLITHAFEPLSNSRNDTEAAELVQQVVLGLFAHAVYTPEGDYPPIVRELYDKVSSAQGYYKSRLLHFTPEEITTIRGTYDFFGLNYYSTRLVKSLASLEERLDSEFKYTSITTSPTWPTSASDIIQVVPWGLRQLLNWIKKKYNNVPVFITENGFADRGEIQDTDRIMYIISHMSETIKAIHEDGCNVIGYTVWSLIDNMEWISGYRLKFGLYHVNFTDQNRQRTPKLSAYIFSEINRKRRLPRCFPEATWAFSLKSTKEHNPTDSFLASQHKDPGSCKRKYFPFSSKFLAAWLATLI